MLVIYKQKMKQLWLKYCLFYHQNNNLKALIRSGEIAQVSEVDVSVYKKQIENLEAQLAEEKVLFILSCRKSFIIIK